MRIKIFSQVEKTLSKESKQIQLGIREMLLKLENNIPLTFPHSRPFPSIHSQLHELRLSDSNGIFRVIYYIRKKDAIYLIHAFRKKSYRITTKDRNLMLQRIREIIHD